MGKFNITPEQLEELKHGDFTTPIPIEGADGQGKGTYHNPVTGKEIRSLTDPYHRMLRERQGWRLGPASPELREKWLIREAELRVEDDKMEADYLAAHPQGPVEDQRAQFNEAVTAAAEVAALAIIKKLGIDLPGKTGAESTAPAPAPEGEPEGVQLPLPFLPTDAPSESETKHVVSQASQPALHLVE